MNNLVKDSLIVALILCLTVKGATAYYIDYESYITYDNVTLSRLKRQSSAVLRQCTGDPTTEYKCATTPDCIDVNAKCNGKEDCPDGSDERESVCKNISPSCVSPPQPQNGKWTYIDATIQPTDKHIASNTIIRFSCNPGYKLSSTNDVHHLILCLNSGKFTTPVMPTCQKLCKAFSNNDLISYSCKTNNVVVPCDKATDSTIMRYKCAQYYEPPVGRPETSVCYDGAWDNTPECIAVCGEKRVAAETLILNGDVVERGNYPWVVALYSNTDSSSAFSNICGGSLLTTNIVLTAAHCVTRGDTGQKIDPQFYRVAAGKYYNQYEDEKDRDTAQYAEVQEIAVHKDYQGEIQNFLGDIALLKLKKELTLSQNVQPVCFHNLPHLESKTKGLVTGWGYTTLTGQPADKLHELELPYNDDKECVKELDPEFAQRYFVSDKMCAGFSDKNTSVCKGDSGGGLVFINENYKYRYFIHGIVSLTNSFAESKQTGCNVQHSALFTRVETYLEWIQIQVKKWTTKRPKCVTPAQPQNGRWVSAKDRIVRANESVDPKTVITFTCDPGYKLSSTNNKEQLVICQETGEWTVEEVPTCLKTCNVFDNTELITYTCYMDGSIVPCNNAAEGTILTYKCAQFYKIPVGRPDRSICYGGMWDYTPECIKAPLNRTSNLANGISYLIGTQSVTWIEAYVLCRQNKMELASITSPEEEFALENYARNTVNPNVGTQGGYWIAGTRHGANDSDFVWLTSGKPLNYRNFAPSQPDNQNEQEACLELYLDSPDVYAWNDSNCDNLFGFICQTSKSCK